jgi:hypothetical protein
MRLRANEAMMAALAAADACAPFLPVLIEDTMTSIDLVCEDATLDLCDRLVLIDDALLLIASLKKLSDAAHAARPELIVEVVRRTNSMLCRYAQFVRAERASS